MRKLIGSGLLLGCVFLFSTAIRADETWTGTVSNPGDWNVQGNWSGNAVPISTDNVTVSLNTPNIAGATLSTSTSIAGLLVGLSGTTGRGSLTLDGGSLSTGWDTNGLGGGSGGTLSIINNGFLLSTGSLTNGRGSGVSVGSGTLLLSSGTLQANSDVYFGGLTGSSNASKGYYQQDDGVATLTSGATNLRLGASQATSTVGGSGTMILNGGTLNIPSTSVGLVLADGSSSFGAFAMTGGTLIFQNKGIDVGRNNGSGSLYFSGGNVSSGTIGVGGSAVQSANNAGQGTMTVTGSANVTITSGNQLLVGAQQGNASANASTSNGTLLMQGGVLTTNGSAFIGSGNSTNTAGKIANGTMIVSGGQFTVQTLQLGRQTNANGYLSLQGGQMTVNALNGPTDVSSTGTFSFTGGTLQVRDSAIDITNSGGTFSPGGSGGVGTTGFASKSYTQSSGTLWIDIASGTFDTVSITGGGTASIAGTIKVATADTLTVGQTFDVLVATLVTLDPGTAVTGTDGAGHPFSASVVNSGTTLELMVNDVPEPAVLSGSILAAAFLLKRRHRRGELKLPRRLRCA